MKQVRLLAVLFLFPILVWAQSSSKTYIPRQLYIGPTAGVRLSNNTFFDRRAKNDFSNLPAPGFDAGLFVSRRIKEHFCLNAQLIYSQKSRIVKGGTDSLPNLPRPDKAYLNTQVNRFIELPIYYMYEFKQNVGEAVAGNQRSYKWFIGAGPTISYWLGGKGKLKSSNVNEDPQNNGVLNYGIIFNEDNNTLDREANANKLNVTGPNRFQFALNFTGGVALEPDGLQKIIIAAHFELGQSFMAKDIPGYFPGSRNDIDVLRTKYHSLRLSVGYLIDTKLEESKRGKSTINRKNVTQKKRRR